MPTLKEMQDYAAQQAAKYGVKQSTFFGLIQTESSWNPYADAKTSSAYGLTQLLRGTAKGLGVDRTDWKQNVEGGARLLGTLQKQYGNERDALVAYHDGPAKFGQLGGHEYAAKVLANSKSYAQAATKNVLEGGTFGDWLNGNVGGWAGSTSNAIGEALSYPGDAIDKSIASATGSDALNTWFGRVAIAVLALIFIAAGLLMMKPVQGAISKVAPV